MVIKEDFEFDMISYFSLLKSKINLVALFLSIALLVVSFLNQYKYLLPGAVNLSNIYLAKIVFFLIVFKGFKVLVNKIIIIKNYGFSKKDKFAFLIFLWFVTWFSFWLYGQYPGFLFSDSLVVIRQMQELNFTNWFSALHPFVHLLLFQFIPHPIAIPIFQLLLTSFAFTYSLTLLYNFYPSKWILFLSICILSFSAPIIGLTLFYTRDTIFGIIHFLLAIVIFKLFLTKKKIDFKQTLWISLLTLFLALYRGEGFIVLIFVCLCFYFLYKNRLKKFIITVLSLLILFFSLNSALPLILKAKSDGNYKLTLILNPLGYFVQNNYYTQSPQRDKEIISNVLDYEKVKQLSTPYEIPVYWAGGWYWQKTNDDFRKLYNLYNRILLENIPLFLANRIQTFLASSGFTEQGLTYEDWLGNERLPESMEVSKQFNLYFKPSEKLHEIQKNILLKTKIYNGFLNGKNLFWNFMPHLTLILIIFLLYKWIPYTALASGLILCRVPILFLINPASQFKYYYSVYLFGSIVLFLAIVEWRCKVRDLKSSKVN